jgi:pimeloyl-ACP methyl ester carboxylesterase
LDENGENSKCHVDISQDQYGVNNTYMILFGDLKAKFGTRYQIIFFPYDWRIDIGESERLLEEHINRNFSEVMFVCHSTGGLLAADYIAKSQENQRKTKGVITIGTPLFGTCQTLWVLENGFPENMLKEMLPPHPWYKQALGGPLSAYWAKNLGKNSPCTYQLLPSEEYFEAMKYEVSRIYEDPNILSYRPNNLSEFYQLLNHSRSQLNHNLIDGSGASHKKFREIDLKGNIIDIFKSVKSLHIGSGGVETLVRPIYKFNKLTDIKTNDAGDNTAMLFSALGQTKGYDLPLPTYIVYQIPHEELPKNQSVIDRVCSEISAFSSASSVSVPAAMSASTIQTAQAAGETPGMSDDLKFNVSGRVNLKIYDANGVEKAVLINGISEGFSENGFFCYVLDEDGFICYIPSKGYAVEFSTMEQISSDFSCDISTLDREGDKTVRRGYARQCVYG